MNNTTKLILVLILLIVAIDASAQFGNNGYGNNGYGNGRNQMGSMSQPTENEKPKEIPAEVIIAKYMEDMKPALALDELQAIAIANVLVESVKAQGRITKLNLPEETLLNEYKALSETTDRKVIDFLNKDQKEKYMAFKEQARQPKKSKSKAKKKEKKEEKEKSSED